MRGSFKYLTQDKLLFRLYLLSMVLIFLTVLFIILNYRNLPPLLPVFNQLPWGEQRLSQTPGIFIPSIVATCVLVFNIIAASAVYSRSPLISRMFAVTSFLTSLLTLLFVVRTIQLVI